MLGRATASTAPRLAGRHASRVATNGHVNHLTSIVGQHAIHRDLFVAQFHNQLVSEF